MKICSKCGKQTEDQFNFCVDCGGQLIDEPALEKKVSCPVCGGETDGGMKFCTLCGANMKQQNITQPMPAVTHTIQSPSGQQNGGGSGGKVGLIIAVAVLGTILAVLLTCLLIFNMNSCRDISPKDKMIHQVEQVESKIEEEKKISTYRFTKSDGDWYDAQSGAQRQGGYLVSINDYEEFQKVCRLADQEGIYVFWVGARRNSIQDWYDVSWEDGTSITYTNWYPGEPSGKTTEGDEELFLMVFKVKDEWYFNDAPCDVAEFYKGKMGYITEIEE